MFLHIDVISGLMFGIEYLLDDGVLVVDLAILRIYIGKIPKQ